MSKLSKRLIAFNQGWQEAAIAYSPKICVQVKRVYQTYLKNYKGGKL